MMNDDDYDGGFEGGSDGAGNDNKFSKTRSL